MAHHPSSIYGRSVDPPPTSLSGAHVMSRFIDGLAFRYYWATEGLRDDDYAFRPAADSMSLLEVMQHIGDLSLMIRQAVRNETYRAAPLLEEPEPVRDQTLETLRGIRDHLLETSDEALTEHRVLKRDGKDWPIWHIMNGPITDALTHVGQIVSWRRINGNPMAKVNVFLGRPPR